MPTERSRLSQALRNGQLAHLRKHCRRNYGIEFRLHYSRRPWAAPPPEDDTITGTPGYIWHATWQLTEGPGDARAVAATGDRTQGPVDLSGGRPLRVPDNVLRLTPVGRPRRDHHGDVRPFRF